MYIMEVNHLPSHCNWLKLSRNWMCLCAQRCVYLCRRRGFPGSEERCKSSVDECVCVCARPCAFTHIWTALLKGRLWVQYKLSPVDSICGTVLITTKITLFSLQKNGNIVKKQKCEVFDFIKACAVTLPLKLIIFNNILMMIINCMIYFYTNCFCVVCKSACQNYYFIKACTLNLFKIILNNNILILIKIIVDLILY